ncbi:MAG: cyclic nucleotide-binding domain-containing protein [Brumimicrobium sp.]|nr:cyclic nucleotide-binding domain-containing protein [Brumimicrobium sp.]
MEDLQNLKSLVLKTAPFSEETWDQFKAIWKPIEVDRNTLITAAGETEKKLYFVCKGVQRIYYIGENGKEATIVLSYPYSFSGVVDSFLLKQPSKYHFESVTGSKFLYATVSEIDNLSRENQQVDEFIKRAVYFAFSGLLERMVDLQCRSSEEKFKTLLKRSPQVLQVVPHKYIANYLGIDPTNFSKLMNSVKF